MDLLVATTNPGKLREIQVILEGLPVALHTLAEFDGIEEPEETGATFEENARLKAVYYANATGMLTAADDSGLEIDALGGAPGVHSARWHGTDYEVKFRKIRELLDEQGLATSPARFVCCVALARGGTDPARNARDDRGTNRRYPRRHQRIRLRPDLLLPQPRTDPGPTRSGPEIRRQPPRQGVHRSTPVPAADQPLNLTPPDGYRR